MAKNVVNVKYRLRGQRFGSTMLIELGSDPKSKIPKILARYLNVRDENVIVTDIKSA